MVKIDALIEQAQPHLQAGEQVLASLLGIYDTPVLGRDGFRVGVLLATDRRIVLYGKKPGGYNLESFPYSSILSVEESKSLIGRKLSFFASGNKVALDRIKDLAAFEEFTAVFKSRIAGALPQAAAAENSASSAASDVVFDQLRKLGELRDAGIVTAGEFDAKKAELLARL